MLRLFKRGTCKKWHTIATSTPCATYQEFFEVLLWIEDSENAPDDKDEDVGRNAQRYALDRRARVLTPVHLREKADPLVVLIFRIKETLVVQGEYTSYQGGGAQMYTGGQYQNLDVVSSSGGSGRQTNLSQQG
ncbi:hypothetical protein TB2_007560 [Malus domestica]